MLWAGVMAVAALAWLRPGRIRPLPPLGQIPQLPDRDTLWHWIERINAFGPCLTASPAHQLAVDYIAEELAALGLEVHRQTHRIHRWTPGRTAITLGNGTSIPVAAPYPYSGMTGPEGITGDLVWFDKAPKDFPPRAARSRWYRWDGWI
jgi:hypothetical protein